MSMQLRGKKKGGGAAMPSSTKNTKTDASEDTSLTESAMLGPDSPTNAGRGDLDKQEEALFVPAKAKVGKKMINETRVAVRRRSPTIREMAKEGQNRELQREAWRLWKKN